MIGQSSTILHTERNVVGVATEEGEGGGGDGEAVRGGAEGGWSGGERSEGENLYTMFRGAC